MLESLGHPIAGYQKYQIFAVLANVVINGLDLDLKLGILAITQSRSLPPARDALGSWGSLIAFLRTAWQCPAKHFNFGRACGATGMLFLNCFLYVFCLD